MFSIFTIKGGREELDLRLNENERNVDGRFNGMLHHTFLRVGEDISWQNIFLPPLTLSFALFVYLFLLVSHLRLGQRKDDAVVV